MEHLKDILGEVFPQSSDRKTESKVTESKVVETDEIKQALKHANDAINIVNSANSRLQSSKGDELIDKTQLDLLNVKKHLVQLLQEIKAEESIIKAKLKSSTKSELCQEPGRFTITTEVTDKLESKTDKFVEEIKKSKRKRGGSDSQYDNVVFQSRIEDNILNMFGQIIHDKEKEKLKEMQDSIAHE